MRLKEDPDLRFSHEAVALAVFLAFLVEGMSSEIAGTVGLNGYNPGGTWEQRFLVMAEPVYGKPDWKKEPFSTVRKLFRVRNDVSHPKRHKSTKTVTPPAPEAGFRVNMDTASYNILRDMDPIKASDEMALLEQVVFHHYGLQAGGRGHIAEIHFGDGNNDVSK